MMAQVGRLKQH